MKINNTQNQNFGKIYMFPLMQEKFYKDAKQYTGLDERVIQRDVENLIKKDSNSDECIIKQGSWGDFYFECKHGKIRKGYTQLANTFRGFIEALEQCSHIGYYRIFINKYKNEPYFGKPKYQKQISQ